MEAHCRTDSRYIAYAPYHAEHEVWDGVSRVLLCDLYFYLNDKMKHIKVPAGFLSDLGSVPEPLRGLVENDDESLAGFILHDFMYKTGIYNEYSRQQKDQWLYEIIRNSKQSWYRAQKTYWAVRAGGGGVYQVQYIKFARNYALEIAKRSIKDLESNIV